MIVPHNGRRRTEIMLQNAKIKAAWGKPPSIENILERDRERFLGNPVFSEPVRDDEKPAIEELLARYAPEQIAAALMRLQNAQKPAPEELLDAVPAANHQKADRNDFKNSVWVSLSVGHDMSAEARWILPMLCSKGNITKRHIGAIKIHQNETHVELAADCVENFFKAVGTDGRIEKNIVVTRMRGTPGEPEKSRGGPHKAHRKYNDRKPHYKKHGNAGKPKHPFKKKHEEHKP